MKFLTTSLPRRRGVTAGILLAGLALSTACSLPQPQPDLTRFFVLTPVIAPTERAADAGEPVKVVLRPVTLPEFLRGKIMQVRLADNEVRFVDEARWAEPLEAGLTRVLRENLAQRPRALQVVGRSGDEHQFEIALHIRHAEGVSPAGVARLGARIEIFSGGAVSTLVAQEDFTTDIPGWNGTDFGQLAAKLSEAAAVLSERVVALLPAPAPAEAPK